MLKPRRSTVGHLNSPHRVCILLLNSRSETTTKIMHCKNDHLWVSFSAVVSEPPVHVFCLSSVRMSGQKRPSEAGGASSGGPPEKRRERDGGEDAGPGLSTAAGGSTAVETVIKLGLNANTVRRIMIEVRICPLSPCVTPPPPISTLHGMFETSLLRRNKTSKLSKLKTASWEKPLIKDR